MMICGLLILSLARDQGSGESERRGPPEGVCVVPISPMRHILVDEVH